MLKKIIPVALAISTVTFTSVFCAFSPSKYRTKPLHRCANARINDFHGQLDTVKKLTIKMQGN